MLLVIDANVVISSLIKDGTALKVFKYNAQRTAYEFIAPAYLFSELNRKRIQRFSSLTTKEIDETFTLISDQIQMIPFTMFSDKLKEAMDLNFKDSPYLALAMTYNCPIFSGDKGLKKQKKVSVFSPRELLDKITNEEYVLNI